MTDLNGELRKNAKVHFPVLDALRFVLAFWVTIGHFEPFPLFAGVDTATPFGRFVTHAWSTFFFGTPAVIVFFVISGFCIHLPFRKNEKLLIWRYYARRYTRILIPLAGALVIYRLTGMKLRFWGEHSILWESVLWSLVCEEIYYALYPAIRIFRRKFGWHVLLPVTFVLGAGIAAMHRHSLGWHDFGPLGTAFILLPVWLLGCLLAEQSETLVANDSAMRIWLWRFLVWAGCWTAEMLHFKGGLPYTQTMIWFGILAYFWVKKELEYGVNHPPNLKLVAAGAWSYSLYLLHAQGMGIYWRLPIPNPGYILNWCGALAAACLLSYVFYLLVEQPSHQLARKIRQLKVNPRNASEEPVANPN